MGITSWHLPNVLPCGNFIWKSSATRLYVFFSRSILFLSDCHYWKWVCGNNRHFFAIFPATGIGFYFEYDANKKFDLLNAVGEETPVTVIRNGKVREIPRKEIVVGDIVVLNTGEEIPADGILLEAISLQVNESNLTGELMVNKTIHEELFDEEATYPSNEVMRGTTVVDGHGIMKVERVGDSTRNR